MFSKSITYYSEMQSRRMDEQACDAEEKNKVYRDLEGEVKEQGDRLKALGVGENLIFQGILKKQVG